MANLELSFFFENFGVIPHIPEVIPDLLEGKDTKALRNPEAEARKERKDTKALRNPGAEARKERKDQAKEKTMNGCLFFYFVCFDF